MMERRRREDEVSGYWPTPEVGGVSEKERVKPQAIFSDSEVSLLHSSSKHESWGSLLEVVLLASTKC